jgi:nucleotide-binding universal stress UspA family protein
MFTRILVPIDFSGSADAALDLARRRFPDALRSLLHVIDPQRVASSSLASVSAGDDRRALEDEVLGHLQEIALPGEECAVRVGSAADTILDKARSWEADLIVMGTHGRTGFAHFLNGSVAEQVVRHARRPVLIEHERKDESALRSGDEGASGAPVVPENGR